MADTGIPTPTPRQLEVRRRVKVVREVLQSGIEMADEAVKEFDEGKLTDFLASLAVIAAACAVVSNRVRDLSDEAIGK